MSGRSERRLADILALLLARPEARLVETGTDSYRLAGGGRGAGRRLSASVVRASLASGLLKELPDGHVAAGAQAEAWLRRRGAAEAPFLAQHRHLERLQPDSGGPAPLVDRDESPVAALARRSRPGKGALLDAAAVEAAERLRRDFEFGRLQPRVTANWTAVVNIGRRSGEAGGMADLADSVIAARQRVERALRAVGPELAGVLVDTCCLLKGLETVERERQWPARSAKLVVALGLSALARHYGLSRQAEGPQRSRGIRQWGASGYRPEIG